MSSSGDLFVAAGLARLAAVRPYEYERNAIGRNKWGQA